jgi:hypothetical protein
MDCFEVELRLSEYIDSSLPSNEMDEIKAHLDGCPGCSALLREMQAVVALCHNYPVLKMDSRFVERVLLRTSGRPRTRSFRELFHQYIAQPLLTPRLAAGASIAALFLILLLDFMLPRLSVTVSSMSPASFFRLMDRGAQKLYGEGLRVYNKKNEWEEQLSRFKSNTLNSLQSVIEQMDVPVEGRRKTEEPMKQKKDAPKEERSNFFDFPA